MSDDKPTYSFLLPAFNAQSTIRRALDSVLAQGDELSWELIAVDDGSTDETRALLEEYAARDDRIRVFAQENRGCASARALAQRHARGAFLIKFDADDALDPTYLVTMDTFIAEHPGYDFYSCNGMLVFEDETGEPTCMRPYVTSPRFKEVTSLSLTDIMEEPYLLGGGSIISRGLIEKSGGYLEGPRAEDFDFWVRAFLRGARHLYAPYCLYYYTKGIQGQMNEDQTVSYASFVESIENALKTPCLRMAQRETLQKGRAHYAKRLDPAYYEMSGINEQLTQQSEAFYAFLTAHFPEKVAHNIFQLAYVLKKPLDPLRIALARRKEKRKTHGNK